MMTIGELGELVKDLPADTPLAVVLDGRTMNGWIPVTERLPEDNVGVLMCLKNGMVFSGHRLPEFNGVGAWEDDCGEWWEPDDEKDPVVTAWMPLPEPYKGNANDSV